MWANYDRLVVVGKTFVEFDNPAPEVERTLAALQQGLPEVNLEQQGQMIGVSTSALELLLRELEPNLIVATPDRRNANFQLRMAELNRYELENGRVATDLTKRRKNWVVLPCGAESAVRALTPLLNSAGIRVKHSTRGWRMEEENPDYGGWQFSHRVGKVTADLRQVYVGFFHEQIDPEVYRHWMSRGQNHIAVVFTQFGAQVSRLVRPGADQCLDCDPSFESPAGANRAALYFQTRDAPLSFDDARSVTWAVSIVLNRLLDWIDHGIVANAHAFQQEIPTTEARRQTDCACLLDNLEFNLLEEARLGRPPAETVWIGKTDEKVLLRPGNRDV